MGSLSGSRTQDRTLLHHDPPIFEDLLKLDRNLNLLRRHTWSRIAVGHMVVLVMLVRRAIVLTTLRSPARFRARQSRLSSPLGSLPSTCFQRRQSAGR